MGLIKPWASLLGRLKAGAPLACSVCAGVAAGVLGVVGTALGVAVWALGGELLMGVSTISMAMLCWLLNSVALGDNNKQTMANTCNATTHNTTRAVVRCTEAYLDA